MRQFVTTLIVAWTAVLLTVFLYSHHQNIPSAAVRAVIPAVLVEIVFYLAPGSAAIRKRFDKVPSKMLRAAILALTAVIPYVMVSWGAGIFRLNAFAFLLALAAIASFWYAVWKRGAVADTLFLLFVAAVFVSHVFTWIYGHPWAHVPLEQLGRLMWIRVGITALLSMRRMDDVHFGFLPNAGEWRVGLEQYLYFLPVGAVLAWLLNFAHFHAMPILWWQFPIYAAAIFLGALWVLALAEEFVFRGFLQNAFARALHSEAAGLLLAAALFGCVHLTFRAFPNWRFAILAGIAGVFYGMAFARTGSVRASMVTHALVVTTWRLFFWG